MPVAKLLRGRSRRTAPVLGDGWVEPHWLHAPGPPRWTVIGNLDSGSLAKVDGRGLVALDGQRWSLDWWIGAEDRWRMPATDTGVRQELVGATPVVETRLRIPGGDAVHRAFGARTADGLGAVVVEIENRSNLPVALALSLRPYDLQTVGGPTSVEVDGTDVRVDGRLAVRLPAAPRHVACGTAVDGDAAEVVVAGRAPATSTASARCTRGLAHATVLVPLAHTATYRVVLPLDGAAPVPAALPSAAHVVAGWQAHARQGTRVEVPDRRLQDALAASVRHLLLRPSGWAAAAALDRFGFHDPAEGSLLAEVERPGGVMVGAGDEPGAALAALVDHWTATASADWARAAAPAVGALVERLARLDGDPHDGAVGLARLPAAADLLTAAGEVRAAVDVERAAAHGRLGAATFGDETHAAARLGGTVTSPGRPAPPADASVGEQPRRASDATEPEATGAMGTAPSTSESVDDAALRVSEAGVADASGQPSPLATLQQARRDLVAGRPSALARLAWTLGAASGTWTWGAPGDGHDVTVNAMLAVVVRDLLVAERDEPQGPTLALSPQVPDAWLGGAWELHDSPTRFGRLSYAVRWHGDRPALLWELDAPGPVRLTVPGLDAEWSTTSARGEALLAPVAVPERPKRGLRIPVSIDTSRGRRP